MMNNITVLILTVGIIAIVTAFMGNEQIPLAAVSGLVGFLAKDKFTQINEEKVEQSDNGA